MIITEIENSRHIVDFPLVQRISIGGLIKTVERGGSRDHESSTICFITMNSLAMPCIPRESLISEQYTESEIVLVLLGNRTVSESFFNRIS